MDVNDSVVIARRGVKVEEGKRGLNGNEQNTVFFFKKKKRLL